MGNANNSIWHTGPNGIDTLVPANDTFFTGRELLQIENNYVAIGGVIVGFSDSCVCLWALPYGPSVAMIDFLRNDPTTPLVLSVTGPTMASSLVETTVVCRRLAGAGWPGHMTIVAPIAQHAKVGPKGPTTKEVAALLRGHSRADPKVATLGLRVSEQALEARFVAEIGMPVISAALYDSNGTVFKDIDTALDYIIARLTAGRAPRVPILAIRPRKVKFAFNAPSTVVEPMKGMVPSIIHRHGEKFSERDIEIIERQPLPGEWADAT